MTSSNANTEGTEAGMEIVAKILPSSCEDAEEGLQDVNVTERPTFNFDDEDAAEDEDHQAPLGRLFNTRNMILVLAAAGMMFLTGFSAAKFTTNNNNVDVVSSFNNVGSTKSSKTKSSKAPGSPRPSKAGKGGPSCISGDAGVFKINDDKSISVITVKEAVPGDKVQGLDADLNDAVCEVKALGYWGQGTLYGNYTPSHYVRDKTSGEIVEHGEVGDESFGDKYVLLSTCPLILDETEVSFTPLDSDINFGPEQDGNVIAWNDYIDVFNSFLDLVALVGACVMDEEGYADVEGWAEFSSVLNEGYKKCVENGGDDCIKAVGLSEESMKFYAEPCKSNYLAILQPLLDLRDNGDADAIKQLILAK